jgi:uncharacterized protein with HEPN domain
LRDDRVYLELMSESITLVEQYVVGPEGTPSQSLFVEDVLRQDAVLRRLELLADAASHLSVGLKARHPDMSWRRISDFRNVLAHAYLYLQVDRVWRTIVRDLPMLKAVVEEELGNIA